MSQMHNASKLAFSLVVGTFGRFSVRRPRLGFVSANGVGTGVVTLLMLVHDCNLATGFLSRIPSSTLVSILFS
jgi:hypothetical protein